ncbi:hypothetical protein A3C96_03315 [Candidatus Uhrbacteria bacterium RIFCSPHIGHO2_02_FULL_60_10]|uniref:Uncharacterized protein n=1 Tax=Candidatus Uhrbacteria bacterium RIFCSPHIGHO2_02_FULL_60_10 TaxID=1802392 RepID=A0A1F7U882_9BACT|nr:MAG: hypothetical protein A3C96_03315 [Candidatus Uhrbacteria bacterium RIFCSPHIGHO2_02_FULL_60_10]
MKNIRFFAIVLAVLVLPGCGLGDLLQFSCVFLDNPDHCYQAAAVQSADPYGCEKVSGEGFKGSNPPRDKCYLQIAENTGDYEVCKNIKGGMMSYTQEQCITSIATGQDDPEGCKRLSGAAFEECKEAVSSDITADRLREINDEVEAAKSAAGANPDDKDAQEKLKKLLAQQAGLFEFAPEATKGEFMKSSREKITEDIEDEDVKSEIARQFVDFRSKNPGLSLNDQLKKMEEIKDQQETSKRLDEEANALMDQIKDSASDFATDTIEDVYGDDLEEYQKAMAEKGRKYLEEHGGDSIKRGIANLEYMKEKYDKASEQYEKISEQVEKLKKVYDEVSEVYNKVDEINKLVAEGKIDVGRAKVLHGAIYLGKGLEYATDYVPVFGSTISTISKETFDATIKFATKRAARTTAIDKCIDDPANCDPNGISPY